MNVRTFKYLGHMITNNKEDPSFYLTFRISLAFQKWNELKHILTDRRVNMSSLVKILVACIRSRLLYSAQSWELSSNEFRKIETIWLGFLRKMINNSFKRKNVPIEYLAARKQRKKKSSTTVPEPDDLDWAYVFNNDKLHVGRSCIILTIGGKNIMLDCGMHMGFNDEEDYRKITVDRKGETNFFTSQMIKDCMKKVVAVNLHQTVQVDEELEIKPYYAGHVLGAAMFHVKVGSQAVVYTHLDDEEEPSSNDPVPNNTSILFDAMAVVREMAVFKDTIKVCGNLAKHFVNAISSKSRPYTKSYVVFDQYKQSLLKEIARKRRATRKASQTIEYKVNNHTRIKDLIKFLSTTKTKELLTSYLAQEGDYNMTPDRHLGAAWIDKCRPDLLITESTYATTIRDSKRCRERDFLRKIHDTIERGGKVLIPVFALGRAQELCILLETYWEQMNLKTPVYFAVGLTEKVFDKSYIDNPGSMVVLATPGMLHAGLSLQIFKKWAPNENNMLAREAQHQQAERMVKRSKVVMKAGVVGDNVAVPIPSVDRGRGDPRNIIGVIVEVIMPGYCVAGTVGHKILCGAKKVEFENRQVVEVKMAVEYMSFSAHADAKGIMQLIHHCEPANVLLVHGEAAKMEFLRKKIIAEFNIDCLKPANGETVTIETSSIIPVDVSMKLVKKELLSSGAHPNPKRIRYMHGALMLKENSLQLVEPGDAMSELGIKQHEIRFTSTVCLENELTVSKTTDIIYQLLKNKLLDKSIQLIGDNSISVESVIIKVSGTDDSEFKNVYVSWENETSFGKEMEDNRMHIILNIGAPLQKALCNRCSGQKSWVTVLTKKLKEMLLNKEDEEVGNFILQIVEDMV
ncbi:Integrator complex subunit 11 [Nymphon striatum]|nr:Integrator complex subunit 11 [Nymphon striatum]